MKFDLPVMSSWKVADNSVVYVSSAVCCLKRKRETLLFSSLKSLLYLNLWTIMS